jgi:A/G-specific adenine glycosylase
VSPWAADYEPSRAVLDAPIEARWQRLPGIVRHVFTHFPLELTILLAKVSRSTPAPGGMRWTARRDLHEEALPGVMKKVLAHALGDLPAVGPKAASKPEAAKETRAAKDPKVGRKTRGPAAAGEG